MSSNKAFWVTAWDKDGMQVYSRSIKAASGMVACVDAETEMAGDGVQWSAIFAHHKGQLYATRTTCYTIRHEEER